MQSIAITQFVLVPVRVIILLRQIIYIETNTGTDTVNGYSRSVCIGYCSKITQLNQLVLGNGDSMVTILGSMSAGSTVISNLSLGYLSGTTSNIQGQISAVSDNSTLAFSKISTLQSSVKIIGDNIAEQMVN